MAFPSLSSSTVEASRSKTCRGLLCLFAFGVAMLAPNSWANSRKSLCPIRNLYGIECPGCGLTRALFLLCKGDFRKSTQQHPFAPLVALLLGLWGMESLTGTTTAISEPSAWMEDRNVRFISLTTTIVWLCWAFRRATGRPPEVAQYSSSTLNEFHGGS
jgi:hypothetical protein